MQMIAITTAAVAAPLAMSACSGGDDAADTAEAPIATTGPIETPAPTTAAAPVATTVAPAPTTAAAPVATTAAPAPTTAAPAQTTEAPVEAPAAPKADPLMPNVTCMNLQDAQDLIQETGNWLSLSEDATGADRTQIWDRNWFVVAQTPETGTTFAEGEAVLSVLKYDDAAAAEFQAVCGL